MDNRNHNRKRGFLINSREAILVSRTSQENPVIIGSN